MISVIITAYKEDKTIGRAIESFLKQKVSEEMEILVACPDEKTKKVILSYSEKYPNVKHVQDPGEGKPTALNICFKIAKGDKIIMSDGDVYVSKKWYVHSWYKKHGFRQTELSVNLGESIFKKVKKIEIIDKKTKVYSFKCSPYPTFLISGILHLQPYWFSHS